MKKLFITLVAALSLNFIPFQLSIYADEIDDDDEEEYTSLDFDLDIDITKGTIGYPKSPILKPCIYQENHTLYLNVGCNNSTISIIDEDGLEVYSTYVGDECPSIVIPNTIHGNYEIHLQRGYFCFYAQIEL